MERRSLRLQKAIEIATMAHSGQVDKGGHPYIGHPLRVMKALTNEQEQIVGVLHDVIEDTEVTLTDLEREGFDQAVLSALDAITKRAGETYNNYLLRVKGNPLALAVKLADLEDNSDLSRIANPSPRDIVRTEKYRATINYLKGSDNLKNCD